MTLTLDDRVVLVTGGSRGLGREMALALAGAGARVAITGSAPSAALDATAADLERATGPGRSAAIVSDVSDPDAAERAVDETAARFGRIDALVNNAGLGMGIVSQDFTRVPTKFWETEPASWARIIDVNVNGVFYAARAAARRMVAQGAGKIITISTSALTMVRRGYAPYGPSKAAIEAASRVFRQDLEGTGVGVFLFLPGGATDTDLIPGGPERRGADGDLLPADIMNSGIVWLCSSRTDGRTGERYVARLWDTALDWDAAADGARSPAAGAPEIF